MLFSYENLEHIGKMKSITKYISKMGNRREINRYVHNKEHITINTLDDLLIAQNKVKNINEKNQI